MQASQSFSLIEAIGLARLYEARNWSLKKPPAPDNRCTTAKDTAPPLPSSKLTRAKTIPTRCLSPTEMQDRRTHGLCFNCDERFVPRHRCKKLFVIEGVYIEEEIKGEEPDDTDEWGGEEPIISLQALTGTPNQQTMHVRGYLGTIRVMVLMDSGSTHNFLNPQVAEKLGLKPTYIRRMQVTIANGEKINCTGMCAGVSLWLQGEPFSIDFFHTTHGCL